MKPAASKKTNVFQPNAISPDSESRHSTVGAALLGQLDKLVENTNQRFQIVWEARPLYCRSLVSLTGRRVPG